MAQNKIFQGMDRLRAHKRLAWLETGRVIPLSLQGIKPASVLDIGTGSGIFAEAFALKGLAVTGIDLQQAMVEAARKLVPGCRFQVAASEALPFATASFSLCFLGLVLHETEQPLQSLREAFRVCALRTAVLEWPYGEQEVGPPMEHRLRPEQIVSWGKEVGFSRIEEISLGALVLFLMDK